jgi:soluble lytic murein transglycosylase
MDQTFHRSPDDQPTPDRDGFAILSSMARRIGPASLLLVSVAAAAATLTMDNPRQATGVQATAAQPTPATTSARADPLWAVIDQWNRLRQSDRLPFNDYASFLIAHRGWPGEPALRRAAERQILPGQIDPTRVAAFFDAFPPLTPAGRARYAEALAQLGQTARARDAAAAAWMGGGLSPDDEARLSTRFAGQFTPAEQDKRMERLLWDRATSAAARQLAFVSPGRRAIYAARVAFQSKTAEAQPLANALGPDAERDAGYVIDRAFWLRDTNQWAAARTYLAEPHMFDAPPYDPRRYLEALLTFARAAANDDQSETTLAIARQAEAAYPPGTDISQRPLNERDPYTSLVWLGGTTALKKLNRPREAETMFARYAAAAQTPGTQTKGQYWAGRAAQAAGDPTDANARFAEAAANIDQFYGQLAAERLDRTLTLPPDPAPPVISAAQREEFMNREVVRAARLLGQQRRWQDQTQFVRQIAADAKSAVDHLLAGELARDIRRPDLGVMVSREARANGTRDPIRIGFPELRVPPAMESHWTMIHAITRQESQFDREALSPAGARGLMQLMTATAKEQAGKLGLPWEPSRLTEDTSYNVMIGSSFFDRMLNYYNGSYVLAVASYNAGPGNVNRFIRANGDPRLPNVDVVDWIEAIPLSETRAYVQKVLENAVVYDLFNPERARTPERDRLTYYLGHESAG